MYQYNLVAAAGTFDRLHKGHKAFLKKAFEVGKQVLIGITSDEMVQDKPHALFIQTHEKRKEEVIKFLRKKSFIKRAKVISIDNIYGPTLRCQGEPTPGVGMVSMSRIEAIMITEHTRSNAEKINRARKKRGLPPLTLVEVDLVVDTDGKPIASRWIRAGWSDRHGRVFHSPKLGLAPRVITDQHRQEFKRPMGVFIDGHGKDLAVAAKKVSENFLQSCPLAVTVGDVVTMSLLQVGFLPQIAIVDLHVGRRRVYQHISELGFPESVSVIRVRNPRGNVTRELLQEVKDAIGKYLNTGNSQVVQVEGEEDLATLPAVLLSPPGSIVVYGQPKIAHKHGKEGLVVIQVTEEKKKEIIEILSSLPRNSTPGVE